MARYLTDLDDALRKGGVRVVETAHWRSNGHGGMKDVGMIICHHTAGPKSGNAPSLNVVKNGRPGLEGLLAHILLARDGTAYLCGAGLAYHAGKGKYGKYTAGNSFAIGIEAESTGRGDWTDAQKRAYPLLVAALAAHYGVPVDYIIDHKEWALPRGRKIDIYGFPGGISGIRQSARSLIQSIKRGQVPAAGPAELLANEGYANVRYLQKIAEVEVNGRWGAITDKRLLLIRDFARTGYTGETPARIRELQAIVDVRVDGDFGPKTRAALSGVVRQVQSAIGVTPTGVWDSVTDSQFLQARKDHKVSVLSEAARKVSAAANPPEPNGYANIEYLQKIVHVATTGRWGPITDAALMSVRDFARTGYTGADVAQIKAVQRHLNTPITGAFNSDDRAAVGLAVRRIQSALHVKVTGKWDARTERAFLRAREENYQRD